MHTVIALYCIISVGLFCAAIPVQNSELSMQDFNKAVKENDIRLVRQYLRENPKYDLDQGEGEQESVALHHADSPEMTRLLLENGASIDAKNVNNETALHVSIIVGKSMIRDILLEKGCEVDPIDDGGESPLFYAINNDDEESVEVLLQKGASCRNPNIDGEYPVHLAVSYVNGSTNILELVLNHGGADTVNNPNNDNRTSLHYAAINPSPMMNQTIELLMDNGADMNMKDYSQLTPEGLAFDLDNIATATFMRYYRTNNNPNELGKLIDLSEKASNSSSHIQLYVDFVLGLSPYTNLTTIKKANFGEELNWTENFGDLDQHLTTARDNAISWNVEVYGAMRSLFNNLDRYHQKYIQSYHKLEPKLKALKRGKVDEALIKEKLKEFKDDLIGEGYSVRRRRRMYEKQERKLRKNALDYDVGFEDIVSLFEYIKTHADVYKSESNKAVGKLETFRAGLQVDQANFKKDCDWLDEASVETEQQMQQRTAKAIQVGEDIGISKENLANLRNGILQTMKTIRGWNIGSTAVSAVQSAGNMVAVSAQVRETYKNFKLRKMNHGKQYSRLGADGIEGFKHSKLLKAANYANAALSVISLGFSIASLITLSTQQDHLENLTDNYDAEVKKYIKLRTESLDLVEAAKTITMTTVTRLKSRDRLELLLSHVGNALTEAKMIKNIWIDISEKVGEMRQEAIAAKDSLKDDKKIKFDYLFDYLNGINTSYMGIEGLAINITNTFNPES